MKERLSHPLGLFLLAGLFYFSVHSAISTSAQNKPQPVFWEYCAVSQVYATESFSKANGFAQVSYFESTGQRDTWVQYEGETISARANAEQYYEKSRGAVLSKALFQLGQQGWEMVGEGEGVRLTSANDGSGPYMTRDKVIYFKRLKQ